MENKERKREMENKERKRERERDDVCRHFQIMNMYTSHVEHIEL